MTVPVLSLSGLLVPRSLPRGNRVFIYTQPRVTHRIGPEESAGCFVALESPRRGFRVTLSWLWNRLAAKGLPIGFYIQGLRRFMFSHNYYLTA